MPQHALLRDLILVYAVALVFIVVLARVRVPAIVAMIAAGVAAGPAGLGIVQTQEEVDQLAEIGVVLLLFTVGLEFSLTEIRRIWKQVLGGGTLQLVGTALVVLLLLMPFGTIGPRPAFFIGLFIALSSTAIVLKELGQRNQLGTPHGRLMIGVLLLQDLFIVVLLLLVPILSGETPLGAAPLALLRALGAIAIVAIVSRILLPPLLRSVSTAGRREAFPLAILIASVGTAWLSSLLGISMALGAFLGGLVLAESEFSHQAYAEIRPLRDMLAGLFFISLGMLVELDAVAARLPIIGGVALAIVVVKALVAAATLLAVGSPLRVGVIGGIGLAQIGEFSFILGQAGLQAGLLTAGMWQVLLAASIITMIATPSLISVAPRVAAWLQSKRGLGEAAPDEAPIPHVTGHVVVIGYGMGGQLVTGALREIGVPYVILELNGATVARVKALGEPIFYGDATSPDSLHAAGVEHARAVVGVLSDPDASLRMVAAARQISPAVPILVRARFRAEAERLERTGATLAVAEELETSLELVARLLARLDVPGNLVSGLLDIFRRESATMRPLQAASAPMDALPEEIRRAPVATHQIVEGEWAAGKTLGEIDLRAETGALILTVRSNGRFITSPGADLVVRPGDVLYLLGDESDVLLARDRLKATRS